MSSDFNNLKLKEGASHYGRFYPMGYVVAFFADAEDRQRASSQLIHKDWASEDLIEVSGLELAELRDDVRDNRSLWGAMVSKFGDKDKMLEQAAKGELEALLIYAPEEAQREVVRSVLEATAVLAQSYGKLSFSQLPLSNGQTQLT